ncbi:MAG: hypothetical protein Q7S76_00345 [bacterium]|nr:hypothetical protein [bacterium]
MEIKTPYFKPFYTTANRLLRAKVNTIEDVKAFYIGVNELASEIALNSILINELSSVQYSDNQKLTKAITYILGYGQVIGRYSDLFTAKEITLNAFLKKNPRFRNRIGIIQKEAGIYFNTLTKRVEELEKQNKEIKEEMVKKTEEFKRDIKEMKDAFKSSIFSPDRVFKVEYVGSNGGFPSGETIFSPKGKGAHISYNKNIGKFTFNDTDDVLLEGKQKDVADLLAENGMEVRVSWDDINDRFKDDLGDVPNDTIKRSVRTAVTEINRRAAPYLLPGKDLIAAKDNEYWLQYEVDKGR